MRAIAVAATFVAACLPAFAADPPSAIDWATVQPVAAVSVHRLAAAEAPAQFKGGDGFFVVEGRIIDGVTGNTLMRPRLITRPGTPATIEVGPGDRITMKMTVVIDAAGDHASVSTEVRDGDTEISTSTSRFVIART